MANINQLQTSDYTGSSGGGKPNISALTPSDYSATAPSDSGFLSKINIPPTMSISPTDSTARSLITPAVNMLSDVLGTGLSLAKQPFEAASTISQLPGAFGEATKAWGGGLLGAGKAAVSAAKLFPSSLYEVAMPEIGKGMLQMAKGYIEDPHQIYATVKNAFGGSIPGGDNPDINQGIERSIKALGEHPFANVLPFLMLGREAAFKVSPEAGAAFDSTISKVASPVMAAGRAVGSVASGMGGMAGNMARFAGSQATGMFPQTLKTIQENPSEFTGENMSMVDRPSVAATVKEALDTKINDLSETGKVYDVVRNSPDNVTVDPEYLKNTIEKTTGLKVTDGKLETSGSASIRAPGDVSALQHKIYDVWQPEFEKGFLTPEEFLNFRSDMAKMAKYEGGIGKSADLENLSSIMRGKFNSEYRGQIPGLEDIDAVHSGQIEELNNLKKGVLDKEGNLTDASVNRIANASNRGRDIYLNKLEEISPGITKRIQILKAIEDIENAKGQKVGTYTRATLGAGGLVGGIVTGNLPLIAGAITEMIAASPNVAVPLLRAYGWSGDLVDAVVSKLKSGATTINQLPQGAPPLSGIFPKALSSAGEYLKENPPGLTIKDVSNLRAAKGLSAEDIMAKHPDINLKRDVSITDIHGQKAVIPSGEALTPYELKGNKVLLQDGKTYVVSKNQFQNIKGNAVSGEAKPFAPELAGTEESTYGRNAGVDIKVARKELDSFYKTINDKYGKGITMKEVEAKSPTDYVKWQKLYDATLETKTTKYSSYQLPGGKNYREIIIRAPEVKGQPNFESSHWPGEKNPVSHLRVKEYDTKPYGQVTFMEELQSDWARQVRESNKKVLDSADRNIDPDAGGEMGHPLLKNWQELSIKRALKEAVDNNSEYFAWINGEQTSARYNLATHLKNAEWRTTSGQGGKRITLQKAEGGDISFLMDKDGKIKSAGGGVPDGWIDKKLDEVLGKGLADKIMEKESGTLSGEGLKFGGEWANNLYDKQVKDIVQNVTGGKVESMDMGLPIDGKTQNIIRRWEDTYNKNPLTNADLKVGLKLDIHDNKYSITETLGDGKFKALPVGKVPGVSDTVPKTFDISTKKTVQQGIQLTPEIKAKIQGEVAPLKKASGVSLFPKKR